MPVSTSGDVDGVFKPFRAVTPSLRWLIYLSGASAVFLLGWFLFALLPSRKAGVGVHVLPESIITLYSPGQGYVFFSPQIKPEILQTSEIARIRNSRSLDMNVIDYLKHQGSRDGDPERLRSVEQYQSVTVFLSPLKKDFSVSDSQVADHEKALKHDMPVCQQPGMPLAFLLNNDTKSDLENSLMTGASFSAVIENQQRNYDRAIAEATRIYDHNKSIAQSAYELYKEGIISKAKLAEYMSTQATDFNDVIDIKSSKNTSFQNALTATLAARNKLQTFLSQSYLLAPSTSCVVSQIVAPGAFVEANTPILITTTAKGSYPDVIPIYVNADYIGDIKVGNEAIITPTGFSTTQYGGIKGRVIKVSETIQTAGQMLKTLGVDTVSDSILKSQTSPFLVLVKLQKSKATPSGYEWTSSKGPDFTIPITTLMNATIITSRVSPATMALPALRDLFTSNPLPPKQDQ